MAFITREGTEFVRKMVRTYGVVSCFDNVDEETNPLEEEGLWFECPLCGEPILIGDDYDLDEVTECCPVCEGDYYEED